MTTPTPTRSSHIGLYRSGLTSPEHRRHITVARSVILPDTLGHLRGSMTRKSKHHMLFIGPRGIGKTHLLSLIEDGVAADAKLAAAYVVARFPEESNRTLSFADFLLGLCEILKDKLPGEPVWRELHATVAEEEDNSVVVDTLVPALRQQNRAKNRTVLVMLENLNELFTRQIRDKKDVAAMRKFFMDDNGCQLIATAPTHFDAITSVSEPFYDFFDVQVLDYLTREEAIDLIRRNLEWEKRLDILCRFDELRPKIMALHTLTSGNPRLTLMLYELIAQDSVINVRDHFLQQLDRVTPLYQDRLRDIAPQERAVLETIAQMRSEPRTPANIARRMRLSQPQASSLLKRLTESNYLKAEAHPTDKRSRLYTIREGFFDLWLYMNLSRAGRKRLPILAECLSVFYTQWEEREKKRREYREKYGDPNAREGLDLLSEVGEPEERAQAKLDLAKRQVAEGHAEDASLYLAEARSQRLDPMGRWIFDRTQETISTNYLDEIEELVQCWTQHRSGDLEAFMDRLSKLGESLTLKTFSEVKLAFLKEHLPLVTDPQTRIQNYLKLGSLLNEIARFQESEEMTRKALDEATNLREDAWISTSLNNLAQILFNTNRIGEAEPIMRQALSIDRKIYGESHSILAINLSNLALLLQSTNRLEEAEILMRRAVAINQKNYDNNHPRIANSLSNLAQILRDVNNLVEAEQSIRSALSIYDQVYDANHPSVAVALSILALLLQDTGRATEAEPLLRRALMLDERNYGINHPKIGVRLNNLALLLEGESRHEEAEMLIRRSIEINELSYGDDHPFYAINLNNLAHFLIHNNRPVEAEPLLRKSLQVMLKFIKSNNRVHTQTADTIKNYIIFLKTQKNLSSFTTELRGLCAEVGLTAEQTEEVLRLAE